ncbi:MAG: hypothetical protein AAF593_11555 [Planctomycetota bacterium]
MELIEQYRKLASVCADTDYSSKASVAKHNHAINQMRSAVAKSVTGEIYWPLLDEELCAKWLAFQLIELTNPPIEIRSQCFEVVTDLASSKGAIALGARMWLDEFNQGV